MTIIPMDIENQLKWLAVFTLMLIYFFFFFREIIHFFFSETGANQLSVEKLGKRTHPSSSPSGKLNTTYSMHVFLLG